MEEIANNIFIETGYKGVVLTALRLKKGFIIVDSPFKIEEQRDWRTHLNDLGSNADRLLVMMDTNIDRTMGVHAMESLVVGHVNTVKILQNRPTSGRGPDFDAGAECETYNYPSSIRWMSPDMTYSDSLSLYWDDEPVILSHHQGAHIAGTWLQYNAEKLIFVGDSVMVNQPPFLAQSDLEVWLKEMDTLLSDTFRGYKIISSRGGLVRRKSIDKWKNFLLRVKGVMDKVASRNGDVGDLIAEVPDLLKRLNFDKSYTDLYHNRLTWGLETYYQRHFLEMDG